MWQLFRLYFSWIQWGNLFLNSNFCPAQLLLILWQLYMLGSREGSKTSQRPKGQTPPSVGVEALVLSKEEGRLPLPFTYMWIWERPCYLWDRPAASSFSFSSSSACLVLFWWSVRLLDGRDDPHWVQGEGGTVMGHDPQAFPGGAPRLRRRSCWRSIRDVTCCRLGGFQCCTFYQ